MYFRVFDKPAELGQILLNQCNPLCRAGLEGLYFIQLCEELSEPSFKLLSKLLIILRLN